jgi:hypothetical protein
MSEFLLWLRFDESKTGCLLGPADKPPNYTSRFRKVKKVRAQFAWARTAEWIGLIELGLLEKLFFKLFGRNRDE